LLPITDVSRSRGMQFRPLSKWAFFVFVANFLILMQLGAKHVESPFIEFGQISTVIYFLYFTVVMYGVTIIENSFVNLNLYTNTKHSSRFNLITKNNNSCHMDIKTSSFLYYPLLRPYTLKISSNPINTRELSSSASIEENYPILRDIDMDTPEKHSFRTINMDMHNKIVKDFTIFWCIDMDTETERFIPLIWDKDDLLFIRDPNKKIRYIGSCCVWDEDKDNHLAEKSIQDYLKSENVCVCSS
jgi:hypothetical protein